MKPFRFLAFAIFSLAFMFTSCSDENIDDTNVVIEEPNTDPKTINPLLSRSTSSNNGLDLGCFSVLYPFELVDDQGTNYNVNDSTDLLLVFGDSSLFIVDFAYPLNIEDDGIQSTINSSDELANAFSSCLPTGGWDANDFPAYDISYENSCYALVYPVSLEDTDGNVTIANNAAELDAAIASDIQFFVWPISLEQVDGTTTVVNNTDELFNALISCNGFGDDTIYIGWEDGFEFIGCLELSFPFDVVLNDGTTVTVNNHMEYCDLMLQGSIFDFVYPLSFTTPDGQVVTVQSEMELYDALSLHCGDIGGPAFGNLSILYIGTLPVFGDSVACFNVVYPVDAIGEDSVTQTINNQMELESLVTQGTLLNVVFPVSVTYIDAGTTVTATNEPELFAILEGCN